MIVTFVPRPRVLSCTTVPPCCAIACRASTTPSPVPPGRSLAYGGLAIATALLVLARSRRPELRAWLDALDVRVLVAFHILRAPIGLWFLVMYAEGRLPGELALRAGWGDIATGLLALAVLPLQLVRRRDRALLWAWNAFGLADIAMVVLTAQGILLFGDAAQLAGALGMPFLLLPWFVVPLVIATHLLVFARLRATRYGSPQ